MLQDLSPFPRTTGQWIGAITILVGWVASLVIVWTKLVDRVDGLGGRVDALTAANSEKDGRMARYENELAAFRHAITEGAKQIGSLETIVEGLDDHITGMELKIEGRLSEIKDLIASRDTLLRERVAKLETFHERD